MKTYPEFVRLYGECRDGQWTVVCLDFSLAAQDASLAVARRKLTSQIASYIREATTGADKAYGEYLLGRSAPLKYWLKFYFFRFVLYLRGNHRKVRAHLAATRHVSAMLPAA